jgi:hypothetical protein
MQKKIPVIVGYGGHIGQISNLIKRYSEAWLWDKNKIWSDGDMHSMKLKRLSEDNQIPNNSILIGGDTNILGQFIFPPENSHVPLLNYPKICHPVTISDLVSISSIGKYVACGYPGSGNGIIQGLLEEIIKYSKVKQELDEYSRHTSSFASNYSQMLAERISNLRFASQLKNPPAWATYMDIYGSVRLDFQNERSVVYGLPIRNYLYETIHKTHEPFNEKISKLTSNGSKCLLIYRNPMEIITSIANKLAGGGIDLLNDEWLYRLICSGLIAYYKSFSGVVSSGVITAVAYEDVQLDFEGLCSKLANFCDADLSNEVVKNLKKSLLNVNLNMPGHLWQPEVHDKWRSYLTPRHIEVFLEEGVNEILEQFGYKKVYPNMISGPRVSLDVKKHEKALPGLLLHCIKPKESGLIERLCDLTGCFYGQVDPSLSIISTNKSLGNEIKLNIENTDLQTLCISGRKLNEKI